MRIDKQARAKTRKKYARSVRRLAGIIRWGCIVIGVIVGLVVALSGAMGGELTVTGVTQVSTDSSFYSQLADGTEADVADPGEIAGGNELADLTSSAGMIGSIAIGVVIVLLYALLGWMGSVALYGFAEHLYCQEEMIAQNTKQIRLLEKIAGEADYEEE